MLKKITRERDRERERERHRERQADKETDRQTNRRREREREREREKSAYILPVHLVTVRLLAAVVRLRRLVRRKVAMLRAFTIGF